MGLFSFFIKSPQKAESTGDVYFESNKFGFAKLEYESALDIIEKKHPHETAMKDRLLEKLRKSKESLARQHLEEGDRLVQSDMPEEAEKLFSLALSLTEDPELQQELKERFVDTIPDIHGEEPEDLSVLESDDGDASETCDEEHEFEVLCMTLPEEMGLAYKTYGGTFKEGFLALSHGDFNLAAEKLQRAMEEHPSADSHIPVELATALLNLGQTESAITQLSLYLENHPASFHGISLLCDIYCDLKQFDFAKDVIEKSPEVIRKSIEGRRLSGRLYYLEGDYQRAEEILRDVLYATDWEADSVRDLAMTLAAADKTEEALTLFTDLLNQCSRCGQRTNPLDKKAYADLSLKMNNFSDKILNIYLDLAYDHEKLRSDCYYKASMIFSQNGNEKEASRFRELAEETS